MEELYEHAANALHTAAENFKQQVSEKGAIDDWQPMQVCTFFYAPFSAFTFVCFYQILF